MRGCRVFTDTGRCALPIWTRTRRKDSGRGMICRTFSNAFSGACSSPWERRKAFAVRHSLYLGSPDCPNPQPRVKTLRGMAHPPCREVPAGNGVRGPVDDVSGHAAHEAPQGGAERRHDAVRAGPADKRLARPVRRVFPDLLPAARLKAVAGFHGVLCAVEHAQRAEAARGQRHGAEK